MSEPSMTKVVNCSTEGQGHPEYCKKYWKHRYETLDCSTSF